MPQKYTVTIETIYEGILCTVTQEGATVTGVASAVTIEEAFDLAHADYVEQL